MIGPAFLKNFGVEYEVLGRQYLEERVVFSLAIIKPISTSLLFAVSSLQEPSHLGNVNFSGFLYLVYSSGKRHILVNAESQQIYAIHGKSQTPSERGEAVDCDHA